MSEHSRLEHTEATIQVTQNSCATHSRRPSARADNIPLMALLASADLVLNEVHPFRRVLLELIFGQDVSAHDGEHIDYLLVDHCTPDVVIMNTPFSSSVVCSHEKHIAAKHLIGAAKRLAPRDRLVATMPMGSRTRGTLAAFAR